MACYGLIFVRLINKISPALQSEDQPVIMLDSQCIFKGHSTLVAYYH